MTTTTLHKTEHKTSHANTSDLEYFTHLKQKNAKEHYMLFSLLKYAGVNVSRDADLDQLRDHFNGDLANKLEFYYSDHSWKIISPREDDINTHEKYLVDIETSGFRSRYYHDFLNWYVNEDLKEHLRTLNHDFDYAYNKPSDKALMAKGDEFYILFKLLTRARFSADIHCELEDLRVRFTKSKIYKYGFYFQEGFWFTYSGPTLWNPFGGRDENHKTVHFLEAYDNKKGIAYQLEHNKNDAMFIDTVGVANFVNEMRDHYRENK